MNIFHRLALTSTMTLSLGSVSFAQHYTETKLQANSPGVAEATDPQLVNPWGLARTAGSAWWVADNAKGVSTLYNGPGMKQSLVVTIPPANPNNPSKPTGNTGTPTGIISNSSTTDFVLAPGAPADFIFVTLDGTIAAWNPNVALANGAAPPSTHAVSVVKTTDGSVFTGVTSASIDGKRYLYVANPSKGRVDVYDNAFHLVDLDKNDKYSGSDNFEDGHHSTDGRPFEDPQLPGNYVPFNVATIGNDVVVTFVLDPPGQKLPTAGPGFGYVDIFNSSGRLLRRLELGSWLNVPWGVALAPLDFGRFSHDLLVGQFGLYSPAFMTGRFAKRTHEICGARIAKGSIVLILYWLLHRNPRWWPNSGAFDPSRFLSGAEPDRFTYLPFGVGRHVCIGAQLAMSEAILAIARLLQKFTIAMTGDRPVLPVGTLSTRPDHAPAFVLQAREAALFHPGGFPPPILPVVQPLLQI